MAMTQLERQIEEATVKPAVTRKAWMVTFSDLISLLLTFFVLLFSMHSVKFDHWQSTVDSLSEALNPQQIDAVGHFSSRLFVGYRSTDRFTDLDYLSTVLNEMMRKDPVLSHSRITQTEDRLIVSLPGDLLFQQGESALSEHAREAVFHLGGVLRNLENQIGVNGHTDRNTVTSGEYSSNWELSLARAASVANALKRAGYGNEIVAYGLADSRYSQLQRLDEAQRQEMARRVDIVIFASMRK